MRPFPRNQLQDNQEKAVFNYNLSRARMTVECSFGIAAAKWRIFNKPIDQVLIKLLKLFRLLQSFII